MTRSHALKSDIRQAKRPGEAFNVAALRLQKAANQPAPAPLKRIITAYAYQGAFPQKRHALIDNSATRERMGVGNLVIQSRALCGSRGGSIENGGWRLVSAPGDNMDRHSGVDYAPDNDGFCKECTISWREQFQPDEADTRPCAGCGEDLPINKFRPNKARKDGLAAVCEECRRATRRIADLAKEAAQKDSFMARRREVASQWLQRVNNWQQSPYLKPFTCPSDHALEVEVTEKGSEVGLSWYCPCGSTVISRAEFQVIEAMEVAARQAAGSPLTVSMS